jgi:hypothetical protein
VRKAAILFLLAVLLPSLVLAWLAFRSLRDQELILERQRDLLCEGLAVSVVKDVTEIIAQQQLLFAQRVEMLLGKFPPERAAEQIDEFLPSMCPSCAPGSQFQWMERWSRRRRWAARRPPFPASARAISHSKARKFTGRGRRGQNLTALDNPAEGFSKPKPVSAKRTRRWSVTNCKAPSRDRG